MEGSPAPAQAYRVVREELEQYSSALASKGELVVANKMDLTDAQRAVNRLREELNREVLAISAITGTGLDGLLERLWELVEAAKTEEKRQEAEAPAVPHEDEG